MSLEKSDYIKLKQRAKLDLLTKIIFQIYSITISNKRLCSYFECNYNEKCLQWMSFYAFI